MKEQGNVSNFKERFLHPLKESVFQVPTYARQLRDWVSTHKDNILIVGSLLVVGVDLITSEQARIMMLTSFSAAIILTGVFTVPFLRYFPRKEK